MTERRTRSLSKDLFSIVAVVAVVGVALGSWVWSDARAGARLDGARSAEVAAILARTEIQRSLAISRIEVEDTASDPSVFQVAKAGEGPCNLTRRTAGTFSEAHTSVLDTSGDIICSTMSDDVIEVSTYRFQLWLAAARRVTDAVASSPFPDPFTRERSIAIAAAIRVEGDVLGFVTQVVPLRDLAVVLRDQVSAGREMALVIVRVDANEIMSSSGVAVPDPGDDPNASPPNVRSFDAYLWPDGTARVWAAADMPDHGWRVYAGLPHDAVAASLAKALDRFLWAFLFTLLAASVAALRLARLRTFDPAGLESAPTLRDVRFEEAPAAVSEDEVVRAAFVDPTTTLGNRARLLARADEAIVMAEPEDLVGLLLIGIQSLNEPLGSEASEAPIAELALLLAALVPPDLAIFRATATELAILLLPEDGADGGDELRDSLVTQVEPLMSVEVHSSIAVAECGSVNAAGLLERAIENLGPLPERWTPEPTQQAPDENSDSSDVDA